MLGGACDLTQSWPQPSLAPWPHRPRGSGHKGWGGSGRGANAEGSEPSGNTGCCLKAWALGFPKALQVLSTCMDSTPGHERVRVSHSAVSHSLRPHGLQPARLLSMGFSGKSTGVGCHALPRGLPRPRNRTQVSLLAANALPSEPLGKPRQEAGTDSQTEPQPASATPPVCLPRVLCPGPQAGQAQLHCSC